MKTVDLRRFTGLVQNWPSLFEQQNGPALHDYRQSTGLDLKVKLQKNLRFDKRLNNFAA